MSLRAGIGGIPASVRQLTRGNEKVDLVDALAKLGADAERYAAVIVDTAGTAYRTSISCSSCRRSARVAAWFFVMDEVVSGFRVGRRGTMGEYGIVPDLLCLGKAVCQRLPLVSPNG